MGTGDQRETWNGFGDSLARAVELVAIPLIFGLGGWGLDRWWGTGPALMLVLFLFGLAGVVVRLYYGYDVAMKAHEANAPWAKGRQRQAGPSGRERRVGR